MYDVAIIGAGPGGIAAAKYAAQNKLRAVLFDLDQNTFGGTCLNSGCIPTKFFINSSKLGKRWEEIAAQRDALVNTIKNPLLSYLESQGVRVVFGKASFVDPQTLRCAGEVFNAKYVVIASGSEPKKIVEHNNAVYAQDLFTHTSIGNTFLIVGAGSIGIEMASLLRTFGKNVRVIEKEERILPAFGSALAHRLKVVLEKKGVVIETGKDVAAYNLDAYDTIIMAAGRIPATGELMLNEAGVQCDGKGWVMTDSYMRTNVETIYACGDVTGKKLLAYIADYQGRLCIDNILGKKNKEEYAGIADCVFSLPQIASVGMTEEEAKAKNTPHKSIKSNFLKFSSSYLYNDTDGFIQVLCDPQGKILGAGIISIAASELISTFSLCIKNNLAMRDLAQCVFIHPTLSEILPFIASCDA
ncbi:MAG: NAD(P)/FAD-dependent oxidoreductase [Candidatus Omnitrophica bacterium]|nr:NAD(P)/FAD-dependent oxidoreductase [Candidatus Omnitrophota bacterium]